MTTIINKLDEQLYTVTVIIVPCDYAAEDIVSRIASGTINQDSYRTTHSDNSIEIIYVCIPLGDAEEFKDEVESQFKDSSCLVEVKIESGNYLVKGA